MRLLYIFILTLFGLFTNAQGLYDYKTTLKGGYRIFFKVDKDQQYLYLKKGAKTICELESGDKGMLQKNLGYVGADFTHYFVLVHSFGSGNPHYIELIKKTTGKNVLKEGAAWIAVDTIQEFVLYSDIDVPTFNSKMTLYNLKAGKRELFNFPRDIFEEPEVLNRIKLSRLTKKQLVIKYETEKGSRTKMYSR